MPPPVSSDRATTESTAPLLLNIADHVATLTLNRPSARNALSMAMLHAMIAAIAEVSERSDVRAVIVDAAGPVFCPGHDLKELTAARANTDAGRAFFAETMQTCAQMMQAIVTSPKPFIAAVQGTATAAGCQLVATCDLAVASDTAQFCTPGVHIGLFCSTPMVALSRNVANKHAMEMLLLGEMIPADRAYDMGLINRVVPPADLGATATQVAQTIASKSAATVALGKEAFYAQREMSLEAAYAYAAEVMTHNMMARDAEEGIGAFIEKRPAVWSHETVSD
ncbi:MAG: enoyl-CoA hydratase [Pseudomonadota bacterium]